MNIVSRYFFFFAHFVLYITRYMEFLPICQIPLRFIQFVSVRQL